MYVFCNDIFVKIRRKSRRKTMRKSDSKIIRGLIKRAIAYLSGKPRPPPMKCIFLQKMYEIESALDIAVNFTYNNQTLMRKRGVWQWYNIDIRTLAKKDENTDEGTSESKSENKEEAEEDTKEKKGEWVTFPLSISDQIEATYLKHQADLVCHVCITIFVVTINAIAIHNCYKY